MTEITLNDKIQEKTAVALGLFDGVHSGHELILRKTCQLSLDSDEELSPAVFTFRTESIKYKHGKPFEFIYTNKQKFRLFERIFVDDYDFRSRRLKYVLSPDFDDLKDMEGETFVKNILVGVMNASVVVCGDNFRFGKNASCGVEALKAFGEKYNFKTEVIQLDEEKFSSEKYRELLRNGAANHLYPWNTYSLWGEVVHGNHIGNTIGFPTINQKYEQGQLVPEFGVYSTLVYIDQREHLSVTNVGVKPTIEGERNPLAETHILDFDGDLYGREIEVDFFDFIREEKKFNSIEDLKNQIAEDVKTAENQYFILNLLRRLYE